MTKLLHIAVWMDPIADIHPEKDTTLGLLLAAQKRGCQLSYFESADVWSVGDLPHAWLSPLQVKDDPNNWFSLGDKAPCALTEVDIILIRKDPPFDRTYLCMTYFLERAVHYGVRVLNDPKSVRGYNEKLFSLTFPDCCPESLVTRGGKEAMDFLELHRDVIVKPLFGFGGMDVFHMTPKDPTLSMTFDLLSQGGKEWFVMQRYLPQVVDGDKRILLINGEPIPYALARIPAEGSVRANIAAGGRGVGIALSARDRAICDSIGPVLRAEKLWFVGIDVIGDFLTEINVTSPTCARELSQMYDMDICGQAIEALLT